MKFLVISGLTASLILCFPAAGKAQEMAIVEVHINGEAKGEYVVYAASDGDFLVSAKDLEIIGLQEFSGTEVTLEGRMFYSLKSIQGITFVLDEAFQILEIQADPALLERRSVDFSPPFPKDVVRPRESSFFLNYGFNAQVSTGPGSSHSFTATQEAGVRWRDYLLLSDSIFVHDEENASTATRLMTRLVRDDRSSLRRIVIGDFNVASETLGSALLLGGVSFSKKYSMDPTLWRYPTLDYEGFVTLPSRVDVYLDGVQIGSEQFSPGGFGLTNIPIGNGFHDLEVKVRDSLGRERTLDLPLYSSINLLRKGYQDYGYHFGLRRNNFGTTSNQYSGVAFAASHRYGLQSGMTVGFRAEGGAGTVNGGPEMTYRLGQFGVTDTYFSMGSDSLGLSGMAGSFTYTFLSPFLNARVQASTYGSRYRTVTMASNPGVVTHPRFVLGATFSYGHRGLGSFTFDYALSKKYVGNNYRSYALSYTRYLARKLSLSVNYRHAGDVTMDNQAYATLSYYPGKGISLSSSFQRNETGTAEGVQFQKNPPSNTGFSYRVQSQRSQSEGNSETIFYPQLQYKGRYGTYAAEYRRGTHVDSPIENSYTLSASGGMVYTGGILGFTRPVNDSFAVVRVDRLQGVRTYLNNNEIGRTNGKGSIIIPDLNSYVNNAISINDKDVPINYALGNVVRGLSPPWHSGTPVYFKATKTQAFVGAIFIRTDSGEKPVEFARMTLQDPVENIAFMTARDGEFYLENISAGRHKVQFELDQNSYVFYLDIPDNKEMIVDLGKVVVEKAD